MAVALATAVVAVAFVGPALGADQIHWSFTGQTSVTVDWRERTGDPNHDVRYGLTSSYGSTVTAATPSPVPWDATGPYWEARITGLAENTLYHYSVAGGPDHTFRTPPPRGDTSGFTVFAEGCIGDKESYANMEGVQSLIQAGSPRFVLVYGDLTYADDHGKDHIANFYNEVTGWSQDAAMMTAWGNHDWGGGSNDDLRNYKGRHDLPNPQASPGCPTADDPGEEDWFWFDYGNVRFIAYPENYTSATDTDWIGTSSRNYSDGRAYALIQQAQADPLIRFIVTFGHRTIYSSGHHGGSSNLRDAMIRWACDNSKYVLNLNAHSHNYERTFPQLSAGCATGAPGLVAVTATGGAALETDGTCKWLVCTQPSWSAFRAFHHGALKLQITATSITGTWTCAAPDVQGKDDITCAYGSVGDSFTLNASGGDATPPSTPAGLTATAVSSTEIDLGWSASSDNVGVAGYKVYRGGSPIATATGTSYADTGLSPSTSYSYTVAAFDAAGNTSSPSASASATTQPAPGGDTTPPAVSVTSPAAGATVSGTLPVTASASDNVGVVGVRFKLDGSDLGAEDTTAPYSVSWSTSTASNGSHSLTAVARDAAGNSTVSGAVVVSVANGAGATPADEIHWTIIGQTAVTFDWRGGDVQASEHIDYGTTTAYGQRATPQAAAPNPKDVVPPTSPSPPCNNYWAGAAGVCNFWEAKLTGLAEDTVYHYSIDGGPDHTFRTPPPRGTAGFTIAMMGDVGDSYNYSRLPQIQNRIAESQPRFVLLTGDMTYINDHGQRYGDLHYNDMMVWSRDAAYMPTWGNHEWDDPSYDDLRTYQGRFDFPNPQTSPTSPNVSRAYGEDWYWFDYGNTRFISYPEPTALTGGSGDYSTNWADWSSRVGPIMDAAQADPAIRYIVTFGHRTVYSSGNHPGEPNLKGYTDALACGHSKYVLNLNGHSHNYERTTPQKGPSCSTGAPGVVYLTVGVGGSGLGQTAHSSGSACTPNDIWYSGCPPPAYSAFRAQRQGSVRLTFDASGIREQFICGPDGPSPTDLTAALCAEGAVGDSATIGAAGADTTPPVVSSVASSGIGQTTASISWITDEPADSRVEYGTTTGYGSVATSASAVTSHSIPLSGLTPGTTYHFRVRSTDAANNVSPFSADATFTTLAASDTTPPTAPGSLSAAAVSSSRIDLTWSASSDNVGVAGYRVLRSTTSGGPYSQVGTSSLTSYSDPTVSAGTAYYYVVRAYDAAGNVGPNSGQASATTPPTSSGGLIIDPTLAYSVPQVPRPAYLTDFTDPVFRTTIKRIGGNTGTAVPPLGNGTWASDARHHYSTDQPWNSDQTLYAIDNVGGSHNPIFLDGATFATALPECSSYSRGDDWWNPGPGNSHVRINLDGSSLQWYDVVACQQVTGKRWTLPWTGKQGTTEGTSWDGRYTAVASDDGKKVVAIDMVNNVVGPQLDVTVGCDVPGGSSSCYVDYLAVSPSGSYLVLWYNDKDYTRVYDIAPSTMALTPRPATANGGATWPTCNGSASNGFIYDLAHANLTVDPFDGDEDVAVGKEHCSNGDSTTLRDRLNHRIGRVMMVRLRDGAITSLAPQNSYLREVYHTSALSYGRKGWVIVGFYGGSNGVPFNNEVAAFKMDGSAADLADGTHTHTGVERYAHGHGDDGSYRSEMHAVASPDGMKIAFASDWTTNCGTGCGSGSEPKDYIIDTSALRGPDTTPPVVTGVTATGVTSGSATIVFTTDEAGDSYVEYGTTTAYGSTASDASFVTSHSVPLTGLAPGTTYHFRVRSTDRAGNSSPFSGDQTFTTGSGTPPLPPTNLRIVNS